MANDVAQVWHKYLWVITRSLNSLVSRATQTSPELLMFGTASPLTESDPILFTDQLGKIKDQIPNGIYRAALLSTIQLVDSSRSSIRAKNLSYQNAHKVPLPFKVGQIVTKKIMSKQVAQGVPKALTKTYDGPYIILKLFTKLAEVQHVLRGHKQLSNIDYLRPWHENFYDFLLPPKWDQEVKRLLPTKAPGTPEDLPID